MRKRGDRAWYRPRSVHGRDCWEVVAVISGRTHTALVDTEPDAIQEVDRIRRTLKGDELPPRGWEETIDRYIASRKMAATSAATTRYRLASIDKCLGRHPFLVSFDDAQRFRRARLEQASPTTVFHEMSAMLSLQHWMLAKGWVRAVTWLDAELPQKQRREQHLSGVEIGAFLRMAKRLSEDPTLGDPSSIRIVEEWERWHAAAWIFFFGPRTSEMQRMRVRDIDRHAGIVWVNGTKSKKSKRAFVIESEVGLEVIRDTFRGVDPDSLAFPTGRGGNNAVDPTARTAWFEHRCKVTCELAGIQIVSPHILRHTAATEAVIEGADMKSIQNLLGHHDQDFTQDSYSHAESIIHSRPAARAIGRMLERVVRAEPRLKAV